MQRYFDLRDDDGLTIDDEGIELPDLRAVRYEASRSVVWGMVEMVLFLSSAICIFTAATLAVA
jgi:hypothetical protein